MLLASLAHISLSTIPKDVIFYVLSEPPSLPIPCSLQGLTIRHHHLPHPVIQPRELNSQLLRLRVRKLKLSINPPPVIIPIHVIEILQSRRRHTHHPCLPTCLLLDLVHYVGHAVASADAVDRSLEDLGVRAVSAEDGSDGAAQVALGPDHADACVGLQDGLGDFDRTIIRGAGDGAEIDEVVHVEAQVQINMRDADVFQVLRDVEFILDEARAVELRFTAEHGAGDR